MEEHGRGPPRVFREAHRDMLAEFSEKAAGERHRERRFNFDASLPVRLPLNR